MVLVKADAFDVVPRSGLVAKEALADFRFFNSGFFHGDHLKVHHVVAGWCLMTLGATLRIGGGMLKLGQRPFVCGVTGGAILPEKS